MHMQPMPRFIMWILARNTHNNNNKEDDWCEMEDYFVTMDFMLQEKTSIEWAMVMKGLD